jgi:hypothetical protein
VVNQCTNKNGGHRRQTNLETVMRALILAFAFVLAGSSLAGSLDSGLPGVGTFAYNGSPVAVSAPHSIIVAVR